MLDKVGGLCDCCHRYREGLGNVLRTFNEILLLVKCTFNVKFFWKG